MNSSDKKESGPIRGVLCIYVDVGQLSTEKAEAFVEHIKEKMDLTRIKNHAEVFFLPVREGQTRVEFVPFM